MRKHVWLVLLACFLASCGGDSSIGGSTGDTWPERVTFDGGALGIFDPSVTRDPATNRLWMSYSAVDPLRLYDSSIYWGVSVRLAYSNDHGATWQDAGIAGSTFDEYDNLGPLPVTVPAPSIPAGSKAIWQSETSTLIHDPAAPVAQRWKLVWHQYLHANNTSYFFDYSWLAMKTAAAPADLATATPVKLFAGFGLRSDAENTGAPAYSPIGGPPAVQLNSDLTQAVAGADLTNLDTCVFAEPGLYATNSAVYLTAYCADIGTPNKYIVGFRCASPCSMTDASSWVYLGRLLTPADAVSAANHDHYQAPDVVGKGDETYLVVTPVDVSGGSRGRYAGCRVYRFSDLVNGTLHRDGGGQPVEIASVSGTPGTHHGACTGFDGLQGGMIYSQYESGAAAETFRIYRSGVTFP